MAPLSVLIVRTFAVFSAVCQHTDHTNSAFFSSSIKMKSDMYFKRPALKILTINAIFVDGSTAVCNKLLGVPVGN